MMQSYAAQKMGTRKLYWALETWRCIILMQSDSIHCEQDGVQGTVPSKEKHRFIHSPGQGAYAVAALVRLLFVADVRQAQQVLHADSRLNTCSQPQLLHKGT